MSKKDCIIAELKPFKDSLINLATCTANPAKKIFQKIESRKLLDLESQKGRSKEDRKVLVIYTGSLAFSTFQSEKDCKAADAYNYSHLKYILKHLKQNQQMTDIRATYLIEDNKKWLVTPANEHGYRTKYTVYDLISKNNSYYSNYDLWGEICETLKKFYHEFDGFVIIHKITGLDFTASALSFMIHNCRKTIIITGGMHPISCPKNDSINNLASSLNIAANYLIPEVCVYFNQKLLRGNRCLLLEDTFLSPYDTPNYPVLGNYDGIVLKVDWNNVLHVPEIIDYKNMCIGDSLDKNIKPHEQVYGSKFSVNTNMSKGILHIENFP